MATISVYEVLKRLKNGETICFYDLETTGLKKKESRILSFSAIKIKMDGDNYEEVERKNIFLNPECVIPTEVSLINHITNETVKDCPTEKEVGQEIIEFLNSADMISGYNISFDNWFINEMSKRVNNQNWEPKMEFDVFSFVKAKLPKSTTGLENQKLETVATYFAVNEDLTFHDSIDDVIATIRVFWKIKDMFKLPTLISASLWQKYSLCRLYIDNSESLSIYYDIVEKKWVTEDGVESILISNLLAKYNDSIDELLEAVKQNNGKLFFES